MLRTRILDKHNIPAIVDMMARAYAEDPDTFPLDRERAHRTLESLFAHRIFNQDDVHAQGLYDEQDVMAGVIIAQRGPDLWSDAQIVVDHVIYIAPIYRGNPMVAAMLRDLDRWATSVDKTVIRLNVPSHLVKAMARQVIVGLNPRATVYGKEVGLNNG